MRAHVCVCMCVYISVCQHACVRPWACHSAKDHKEYPFKQFLPDELTFFFCAVCAGVLGCVSCCWAPASEGLACPFISLCAWTYQRKCVVCVHVRVNACKLILLKSLLEVACGKGLLNVNYIRLRHTQVYQHIACSHDFFIASFSFPAVFNPPFTPPLRSSTLCPTTS